MSNWSLPNLLAQLHKDVEGRLQTARQAIAHPTSKGDASEAVWLDLLKTYLPARYSVEKAHVVDSNGAFSEQIDLVVFDRQYSPLIFRFEGEMVIPAEGVYAVFEAKQSINAARVGYAQDKVRGVRQLHRTSLPIPHAGGTYPPRDPPHIFGGILTLDSEWTPALGEALLTALRSASAESRLDLGCVASHGTFAALEDDYSIDLKAKAATRFLLDLMARLQSSATAPMLDISAYARWLDKE
ncbi:MAG: hypothetical protein M5U32_18455 [Myxococcota bacterium]|nr:hypothetical protein [Myxococcota bacterium]